MRKFAVVATMFLISVICAPQVFAGNVDPSGQALKNYVDSYLQNAMPNDVQAAKIKAMGGAGSSGVYEWLCQLEVQNALSVGYDIWESRYNADSYYQSKFPKNSFVQANIFNYCRKYSNRCNHWTWNKDCLKNSLGN
ncbi:hypothetical protein [Desulfovibrio sp. JC010]|uniref:hypothetical protein n=1 Tax=Desulfovibrio sp. JC010 TaxID=2593641 RepID=UPI0013D39573|nr:hypothetical protein [Desulfovibrio sp. JC010]NDV27772.1 hypothetical protein [Desulfovibrio sp. JC010]